MERPLRGPADDVVFVGRFDTERAAWIEEKIVVATAY
jgi:hypothetical protein